MKICYTLSNRQKKAILLVGQRLRLALPVPPIEIDDPADWARSVLPADLRHLVKSAEEAEIMVAPPVNGERRSIATLLGQILNEKDRQYGKWWATTHVVIVVQMEPITPSPRAGNFGLIQWPENVTLDGVPLMKNITAEENDQASA